MPRLKSHATIEAAPEAARPILEDLKKKGKFLNIFKGVANSPATLDGYLKFSGALGSGTLGKEAREAIALMLAQRNTCDYCMTAHTGLAKSFGFSDDDVKAARAGKAGSNAKVAAATVLAAAIVNAKGGHVTDADVQAARDGGLSDGDIVEVIATIALNLFTNYFNHVHDTEIDLPNPIKVSAL